MTKRKTSLYLNQEVTEECKRQLKGSSLSELVNILLIDWIAKNNVNYKVRCAKCGQYFNIKGLEKGYDGCCPTCKEKLVEKVETDYGDYVSI